MKRKSIQLSVILCSIALASTGCKRLGDDKSAQEAAGNHLERAESYRQQGQYRAAIIEARNAIQSAPNDTRNIVELATLLNELKQGKQALQVLEPLANSNDHAAVVARADALLTQGKFRSALEYLQAHTSDDADIRFRIAQAQAGVGQTAEAEAGFIALENSTEAAAAKLQLAQLNVQQGKTERANEILAQILQKDPDQIDALVLSAKQAEMHGDLDKAEALLSHALINLPQTDIITPRKVSVLQQLMPILTKLGRSSESLVYAKVLADSDPQGAVLQSKLQQGIDAFKAGKLDEAESLLNEVYGQTHDGYAGLLLGMIKYNKKDYSGAATYLGENVDPEIAPDIALKALAEAEMRLGQPGKLLELIDPEDREHIKDPELRALVGIALVQSGKNSSGEKMLTEALQSAPNNTAVRATLARHYLMSKQAPKAIATLEESLAQKSDNGLQRLLIGAYIAANKNDDALQAARKLAAGTPEQASNYYVLGHTALAVKQYAIGETALQKALKLDANYTPALLDLAQLNLIRRQAQPAADIYQQIIGANADNTIALKGFITAQEILGAKPDSNDIENRVAKIANSSVAHAVIAEYYVRNQRRDDAKRLLATIDATSGNNYTAYVKQLYALAEASYLLKTKDFVHANETALEGLRLNPRNTQLLGLLGRIAIASGANKEAEKIIAQLAQIQPNTPVLNDLRTALAYANGDNAGAIKQLQTAWAANKTDQTGGQLYRALTTADPTAATQFLSEWQSALPNSDGPLLFRAMQFERDGKAQEAQKTYEAVLDRNANNVLALNNLAMIYLGNGDKRAVALAEKAYQLQPGSAAVLDTYGWILTQNGQRQKGVEALQQAASLAPESDEIKAHLKEAKESK